LIGQEAKMTNFVIFVFVSLSLLVFVNAIDTDEEIEAIFQVLANPKLATPQPSIPTPTPEMMTPEVLPEPKPIIDDMIQQNNTVDSSLNNTIHSTLLINNSSGPTNSNNQQQDISTTSPSSQVSFLLRSQDLSKDMEEVR
jgi:hypothetical protein